MKAQLSVEFLVYIGIMMSSLAVMLYVYITAHGALGAAGASAELEGFASAINNNMVYQHSIFIAYVPEQACGIVVGSSSISYRNESYGLNGALSIDNALICPDAGRFARLSLIQETNGTFLLS